MICSCASQIKRPPHPVGAPIVVGNPWDGYLLNAKNINDELISKRKNMGSVSPRHHQYGSQEIKDTLSELSVWLKKNFPKKKLYIGDIALKNGGPFARHKTHQSGRQVDIAYFQKKRKTKGHRSKRFHNKWTEKMVKKGRVSKNLDIMPLYYLFSHFVNDYRNYILTDKAIIDKLRVINEDKALMLSIDFDEYINHVKHHHDHFHLYSRCYAYQAECKYEWKKWASRRERGGYTKEYFFK